jgi:ceramide glucosyltransferase
LNTEINILVELLSCFIAIVFILDRLFKLAAVIHFFHRSPPPMPENWPTISLIQPITQGATNLEGNLHTRLQLEYSAEIQHILVCDAGDERSQSICLNLLEDYPSANIKVVKAEPDGPKIASKIVKMQEGIAYAQGDVLCFVDDDIALKPNALMQMLPYLLQQGVGATFGLACGVSWNTPWSSLMSAFVNSNALLSYIPLTYFTDPFTITGHLFAISRRNFDAAGGLNGLSGRLDDDHELARRLKAINLKSIQTPVVYNVSNEFDSLKDYANQLKRWFVFPRQAMVPYLSLYQTILSYCLSIGIFLPSAAAILAIIFDSTITILSLASILIVYFGVYAFCSSLYLKHSIPASRLPLLLIVAVVTPIQILWALVVSNQDIVWRGQRLRIERGGYFQVLE